MYKKDDFVMIIHPDYPDEHELARVVSNPHIPTILTLEKCGDKSWCLAHVEYVRQATEVEINSLK